jgi:hypothetical protein
MEIKRNDALRYTTTVENSEQAKHTEDVGKFQKTQEKPKDNNQSLLDGFDDLVNPPGDPLGSVDIEIKADHLAHIHRPTTKDPKKDDEQNRSISIAESNEKQKLFTDLLLSNQKIFKKLPEISSDSNKNQAEFTEAAANFKDVQKEAEHEAFRRDAERTFDDLYNYGSGQNIGERIEEARRKSRKVSTPEDYTKQKLFTELMASNKKITG